MHTHSPQLCGGRPRVLMSKAPGRLFWRWWMMSSSASDPAGDAVWAVRWLVGPRGSAVWDAVGTRPLRGGERRRPVWGHPERADHLPILAQQGGCQHPEGCEFTVRHDEDKALMRGSLEQADEGIWAVQLISGPLPPAWCWTLFQTYTVYHDPSLCILQLQEKSVDIFSSFVS